LIDPGRPPTPPRARLFLALWPTPAVRGKLLAWRDAFDWPPGSALVAPEKLHLTLHFIGPVVRERIDEVAEGLALATGSWDSVAKLEAMLTRLEREEGLKLMWYRTGAKPVQSNLLPYVVEVVAADKPGILYQLADFFDRQSITIESLHCSRYRAMQTGADMFSAQVTIGIPADMHIAALRDDFLEFCDHLNLDAIMDPMKF